jgi:ATP-dependent DNA helicase RecQ
MDDPRTRARAALLHHFGYPDFRPGQLDLVAALLAGKDALGILPTGGGKSVTYQIPALLLPGVALVVTPLISLMADQVVRARAAGIAAAALSSAQPPEEAAAVRQAAEAGELRLLFVAPERFRSPSFASLLSRVPLSFMAVDEAHCISQWGHDFRPDYLRLGEVRDRLAVPVLAVTATATPRVGAEIARELRMRDPVRVTRSFDRPNLSWFVGPVGSPQEKIERVHTLLRREGEGVAIVYASTRKGVEVARRRLAVLGWSVEGYHAGLAPGERTRVQEAFMAGRVRVVVATSAFGMGIDKPDVRAVIHLEMSGSLEAYYQEAGRAGRDGGEARCTVLHAEGDLAIHEGFLDRTHPDVPRMRRVWRAVEGILAGGRVGEIPLDRLGRDSGLSHDRSQVLACLRRIEEAGVLRSLDPAGIPREGGAPGEPGESAPHALRVQRLGSAPPDLEGAHRAREREAARLEAVAGYLATRGCRRAFLLGWFGEGAQIPCGRCDRCLPLQPVRREG